MEDFLAGLSFLKETESAENAVFSKFKALMGEGGLQNISGFLFQALHIDGKKVITKSFKKVLYTRKKAFILGKSKYSNFIASCLFISAFDVFMNEPEITILYWKIISSGKKK